jgi:hypothetical protein
MSESLPISGLVRDNWRNDNDDELSTVHSHRIAEVTRAASGIRAISRIVHNSLGEPEMSGTAPLGRGFEQELLSALECLGEYIYDQMDSMRETAADHAEFNSRRGVAHG